MTKCKSCGATGQDGKFCEGCGEPLKTISNETAGGLSPQILAVAVAVVAVIAFVFLITPNNGSAVSTTSGASAPVTSSGTTAPIVASGTTAASTQTLTVSIQGMTCGGCVAGIERKVGALNGVVSVDVYLGEKKGVIVYDPSLVSKETIMSTITTYGYPASELSDAAGGAGTPAPASAPAPSGGSCGAGGGGCGCGG